MAKRRVYLFGIGSPAWQKATGHIVNAFGVPIAIRKRKPAATRRRRAGK